jgi:DNA-binding CsgD family transcriptional regulator
MKSSSLNKKHKAAVLLLAAASYYFLSIDIVADEVMFRLLPAADFAVLRIAYLFAMAAGFLSYGPLRRRFGDSKTAISAVYGLGALFMLLMINARSILFLSLTVLLSLYFAGIVGASAYCTSALSLKGSPCIGRLSSLGMCFAAVLQVLTALAEPLEAVYVLLLAAAMLAALFLSFAGSDAGRESATKTEAAQDGLSGEPWVLPESWMLLSGIAIISMMGGLNDGVLTSLQASGRLQLYTLPRLFYFAGMAFGGWVIDKGGFRGISLMVLFVMIASSAGALFMNSDTTIFINASLYSLFAGIVIIYFTVPLFATVTEDNAGYHPSLGRAVRLPALALGIIIYDTVLSRGEFTWVIVVYILLSALLTLLFILSGQVASAPAASVEEKAPEKDQETLLTEFSAHFNLTQRERDVLRALIMSEADQKDMAAELFISLRTLQAHITSIYRKTGARNRAGLIQLFREYH